MPACTSTDVITPVHDALELALGTNSSGGSAIKDVDSALVASARKALLDGANQLQFVPGRQSYNTVQEALKVKYTWLGTSCQQNQASNTAKEHMGFLNGKDQSKESRGGSDDGIPQPKIVIFNGDRLEMKWSTMQPARVGFANMGNTCFLNSTLQCLVFTPPMANYLLTGGHAQECKASATTVQPLSILQKIKMIAKNMSWGRQEDAHEFLRYVIDAMQKTCQFGYTNLDVHSKQTTVVSQIFGGYLRSQVRCLQCRTPSDTYDPVLDISIDIKNASSVERALQKFVQPEILDVDNAYHCVKCSQKVRAQKRLTIHRVPKVLTIQLKRFDYHRQVGGKVSKHVEFTEKLNLRPFTSKHEGEALIYQLYAVLVHSGHSCNSGHYYCYVRAPNHSWYCMNDSSVTQANLARVLAAEAYILLYARTYQTSLPSKPQQQQGASLSSTGLATGGGAAAGGMAGSTLPTEIRPASGATPAAKPSFLASVASSSSETSSTKSVNGPRTLDGAPLPNKVAFSLANAHSGPSDRPRLILHNPKKSLPSLAKPLSSQPGVAKQPMEHATSSISFGCSQKRPLVPYKDEEDVQAPCASKEPEPTASSAAAKPAPRSAVANSLAAGAGSRRGSSPSASASDFSSSGLMAGDCQLNPGSTSAVLSGSPTSQQLDSLLAASGRDSSSGSSSASLSTALRPAVNATAPNWHVVDNASLRLSSARSEHSSTSGSGTSVNSTQEWSVQLKDDAGRGRLLLSPQQQTSPPLSTLTAGSSHATAAVPGWRVTVDQTLPEMPSAAATTSVSVAKSSSSSSIVAFPVKQASPTAQSPAPGAGCLNGGTADNGSHSSCRDKLPLTNTVSPLPGGSEDSSGGSSKSVALTDVQLNKTAGRTNSAIRVDITAAASAAAAGGPGRRGFEGAEHKPSTSSALCDGASERRPRDLLSKCHGEQSDDGGRKRKKKRKKHKKHRRDSRESDAAECNGDKRAHTEAKQHGTGLANGDNDECLKSRCLGDTRLPVVAHPPQHSRDGKRPKKHKKKRRRSDDSCCSSSSSEQWVEITKANLADKKRLEHDNVNGHTPTAVTGGSKSLASDLHQTHNGSGDQAASSHLPLGSAREVKQAPRWDGTKKPSVTHLLERHSLAGYGASVSSWDGSKSLLNKEADEERKMSRKRTWHDEYEDELDQGRNKKVKRKSENHDYSPDYNKLQRLQDIRNHSSGKADKWRHDQSASKSRSRTAAY